MLSDRDRIHLEAMIAADRTARFVGAQVEALDDGTATVRMTVTEDMTNGAGTCHGGILFTLGDIAFSYACNSGGILTVAASADIQFVAPAHTDDELTAVATCRMRYGKDERNGLYEVLITDQTGALVAIFTGRSAQIGDRVKPM